uniref:(northern house mosquito) hypothetical protein n=1 Tax=Culex pipiens TaxID=7175 RepID=A0A8D8BKM6_CULPI
MRQLVKFRESSLPPGVVIYRVEQQAGPTVQPLILVTARHPIVNVQVHRVLASCVQIWHLIRWATTFDNLLLTFFAQRGKWDLGQCTNYTVICGSVGHGSDRGKIFIVFYDDFNSFSYKL